MNQILHILKKDLHRYKWAWVALIVFSGIDIYLRGTTAGLMDTQINKGLGLLGSWLSAILLFVIVVLIIQEETLVDPDADWISRPICRGKLLASKLITLLLLLAIPQLAEVAILLLNKGAERIPFALAGIFPAFALWLGQVFLSAQTRTLPRFLLLAVSLYVGITLIAFLGIFAGEATFSTNMDIGMLSASTPGHIVTLVQTIFWLVAGIGILLYLYHKRRILPSWGLFLVALGISLVLRPSKDFEETFSFDGEQYLTLEGLRLGGTIFANSKESVEVRALFSKNAVPEGVDLWASVNNASLTHEGEEIKLEEYDFLQKLQPEADGWLSVTIGYAPKQELEKTGGSAEVQFTQTISLSEQRKVDTIPMKQEACHVEGGNRLTIQSFYQSDPKLTISLGASIPDYSLEPQDPTRDATFLTEPLGGRFSFALADRDGNRLRDFDLSPRINPFAVGEAAEISTEMAGDWTPDDYSVIIYRRSVMKTAFSFFSEETSLAR